MHADKHPLQFINNTARAPSSSGNKSGLPAADTAQFHQIIAAGKRAPCVLIHLAFSTAELFHKMYIHVGGWQDSLGEKTEFK